MECSLTAEQDTRPTILGARRALPLVGDLSRGEPNQQRSVLSAPETLHRVSKKGLFVEALIESGTASAFNFASTDDHT